MSKLKAIWFLPFTVVSLATLTLVASATFQRNAYPILGQIPSFELTDQQGNSVSRSDLLGHVVIVNFIFTSCQGACPLLTQKMKRLQDYWDNTPQKGQIHYVSISVDPKTDTPKRLREYARRFGAGEDWVFLTGPEEDISKVVINGFKSAMGRSLTSDDSSLMEIVHSERFVLIDPQGQIRGFFETDKPGRQALDQAILLAATGRMRS